jgi:hypothetical protein
MSRLLAPAAVIVGPQWAKVLRDRAVCRDAGALRRPRKACRFGVARFLLQQWTIETIAAEEQSELSGHGSTAIERA